MAGSLENNGNHIPPSAEVVLYELEDGIFLNTDWQLRAVDYFRIYKSNESIAQGYSEAIGALALATNAEKAKRSINRTISQLEHQLALPYSGPND